MPGSLQARFSMLLAFDDVHEHAGRPHIPFDLTSLVFRRNAEAFLRPFRRVENETPASFEDEADPFPIPRRGSQRDSPLTWRVARAWFSRSVALRPGDTGSVPLPIVSSRALREWVAPSGVEPTPRDESVGNARDRTDALGHSTIIPTRWSLVRGRRKSRRNHASPIPRRVGESRPRGAFHCLCFSRA
jgi:hypothetical protein